MQTKPKAAWICEMNNSNFKIYLKYDLQQDSEWFKLLGFKFCVDLNDIAENSYVKK